MTAHFDNNTVYFTVEEVADRYRVSTATIWRWKKSGEFPQAVKVGPGCTRWRLSDLLNHDSKLPACFVTNAGFLSSGL